MHKELDKSLVYLLIFTAISSLLAYRIVVQAYDGIIVDDYEVQVIKAR